VKLPQVFVQREKSGPAGTPGWLKTAYAGGFECATLEPDWVDLDGDGKRDANKSRFVGGAYPCHYVQSPTRRIVVNGVETPEWTYRLYNVPDTVAPLIHAGNFAGRVDMGFVSDSEACMLLGRAHLELEIPTAKLAKFPGVSRTKQFGVSSSRDAVAAFVAHMGRKPFELVVKEAQ